MKSNEFPELTNMSFGLAIEAMKNGHKAARAGWNGKGMWCIYVPGSKVMLYEGSPYYKALSDYELFSPDTQEATMLRDNPVEILPHFDMWTINAEGRRAFLPGWLASQSDMDATDWQIID